MNLPARAAIYVGIAVAAAVEGEVGFVAAAMLVSRGYLDALNVTAAGAIGAALGDQFYFYMFRGRVRGWIDRVPAVAKRGRALAQRIRKHETPIVLMIRFAPGLRIALAAACAYAGVRAAKFSLLNGLTSIVWAAGLVAMIAWIGPSYLPAIGISGWWSALIPALFIIAAFRFLARVEEKVL